MPTLCRMGPVRGESFARDELAVYLLTRTRYKRHPAAGCWGNKLIDTQRGRSDFRRDPSLAHAAPVRVQPRSARHRGALPYDAVRLLVGLAMAILFFAIAVPLGVGLRAIGWDPLRLRFEPQRSSYWLPHGRSGARPLMTRQI